MLALTLVLAALPPLPAFPSELRPRDATAAPANAALFALGTPAPPVAQVGIAATVDGAPVTLTASNIGCCVIEAKFPSPLNVGSTVAVDVTAAGSEKTATWTIGPADHVAPTFLEDPAIVSSTGTNLVIGVKAQDDTQIGMITAQATDGTIVGATVDGFVLDVTLPKAGDCVNVVVTDVAGNASDPKRICGTTGEGEGEGVINPNAAECEAESPVDTPTSSTPIVLVAFLGVLFALAWRRP